MRDAYAQSKVDSMHFKIYLLAQLLDFQMSSCKTTTELCAY